MLSRSLFAASVALLSWAIPSSASTSRLFSRVDSGCNLISGLDPGKGGRSIALVIDSSNSMATNDPNNARILAAKALIAKMVDPASAVNGKTKDQVAVIKFCETSQLLYPLGDTPGALTAIEEAKEMCDSTFIGGGVDKATAELTKPGASGSGQRGIIILTDGTDTDSENPNFSPKLHAKTVQAVNDAASHGIRVFVGYIYDIEDDSLRTKGQDLVEAVGKSGGLWTDLLPNPGEANARLDVTIQSFLLQIAGMGLVGPPDVKSPIPLYAGLRSSTPLLRNAGPNVFTYAAKAGETVTVTVHGLSSPMTLTVVLADHANGAELARATTTTDASNSITAKVEHAFSADTNLDIRVSGAAGDAGQFSVQLDSTRDPCAQKQPAGTTTPPQPRPSANVTAIPSNGTTATYKPGTPPTRTPATVATGGADHAGPRSGVIGALLLGWGGAAGLLGLALVGV